MNVTHIQLSPEISSDNILRKKRKVVDMNKQLLLVPGPLTGCRAALLFMLCYSEANEKCQTTDRGRKKLGRHMSNSRRIF